MTLRIFTEIKRVLLFFSGYSGHELGFVPTLGAVALGARIVERHFTLDRNARGSDHACSLDPAGFADMVAAVRTMEKALASREKAFLECERPCWNKLGKSLVAARDLTEGQVLGEEDLCVKASCVISMNIPLLFRPLLVLSQAEELRAA